MTTALWIAAAWLLAMKIAFVFLLGRYVTMRKHLGIMTETANRLYRELGVENAERLTWEAAHERATAIILAQQEALQEIGAVARRVPRRRWIAVCRRIAKRAMVLA